MRIVVSGLDCVCQHKLLLHHLDAASFRGCPVLFFISFLLLFPFLLLLLYRQVSSISLLLTLRSLHLLANNNRLEIAGRCFTLPASFLRLPSPLFFPFFYPRERRPFVCFYPIPAGPVQRVSLPYLFQPRFQNKNTLSSRLLLPSRAVIGVVLRNPAVGLPRHFSANPRRGIS